MPIETKVLGGLDSLLSIVQMPSSVPVATMGIGNAKNARLMAARILAIKNTEIGKRLEIFREEMAKEIKDKKIAFSVQRVADSR